MVFLVLSKLNASRGIYPFFIVRTSGNSGLFQPTGVPAIFILLLCVSGTTTFFPCWFSTFLTLLRRTNGNVLVFTDSHVLLNRRKKNLLNRVCDQEYVLDVSMPVTYISFVLEHYLNRKRSLSENCKISLRELAVIDGFLNGVNASYHSSILGIEPRTLYQHRKNCANKLGVRNLKDLLRL